MRRLQQLRGGWFMVLCGAALASCSDDEPAMTSFGSLPNTMSSTLPPPGSTSTNPTEATNPTSSGPGETSSTGPGGESSSEPGSESASSSTDGQTTGPPASCGDGVLDDGEECDDGNPDDADACTNACTNAACGDGIVGPGEGCDDGNQVDDDDCTNACAPASCGDGVVFPDTEECDDGNMDDADDCLNTCKLAACGDMVVQAGVEECDDGNTVDTDACTAACTTATCGDMAVQDGVEECDDGNMVDTDACTAACKAATCGDMLVQMGVEECDDGNMVDNDACTNACKLTTTKSCKQLHIAQPNAPSGLYQLDPDGLGGNPPFQTYCDMTTDGGGWTLILNRNVNSDQTGQPDINLANGVFDNTRATNWNLDVDLFWTDASQWVFADKQNDNCNNCTIAMYDSAIRSDKPAINSYSNACPGLSSAINVTKLVGPQAGQAGQAYQCGASLGWGNCSGKNCHFGTHFQNTDSDGQWSQNQWNEMHFPSAYSSYKAYGNYQVEGSAWCRSCGGGLPVALNSSITCCNSSQFNAKARWTIWAR